MNYLGIILDAKLTWREHVKQRISKAYSLFWLCLRTIGNTTGIKPKIVRWLHTGAVRPMRMCCETKEAVILFTWCACSTVQAEICAILACAKECIRRTYTGEHIYMCSVSEADLRALQASRITSKIVSECLQAFCAASSRNKVKLL
jgi:hypothetical protein